MDSSCVLERSPRLRIQTRDFGSESGGTVYVNNKGSVIIPIFQYISFCYVKKQEWAALVEVCEVYRSLDRLLGGIKNT